MTVPQAAQHYLMKNNLHEDLVSQANSAINPSLRAIRYVHDKFMHAEHGGVNDKPVMDSILDYARNHPELILKIEMLDRRLCAVLVTSFMQRVHQELREAGEVVFVDASSFVDQSSSVVIPMLCAGPAGAALLAVIFTTSQDEAILTKGFSMVKESLGATAFFWKRIATVFHD
ncbi:hypothetical protein O3P69_012089 [Scylla paramamosain]|uniref:MULE transposase domain-containing protein n=1 Tax=Scylla paramamosain TaxID=85552 RepID=A0AAW0TES9_SCYPA